jgi:hypothetical protein
LETAMALSIFFCGLFKTVFPFCRFFVCFNCYGFLWKPGAWYVRVCEMWVHYLVVPATVMVLRVHFNCNQGTESDRPTKNICLLQAQIVWHPFL